MIETALRGDALTSSPSGFEVRVALPWIRSMPVACVRELTLTVDGGPVPGVRVILGSRVLEPPALAGAGEWWFLQDRLVLAGDRPLKPGTHAVSVGFELLVPYLQAGPGTPLVLPFALEAALVLDAPVVPSVSRDVA
jgi:hypothetical protein